jgi:hypothetical protein
MNPGTDVAESVARCLAKEDARNTTDLCREGEQRGFTVPDAKKFTELPALPPAIAHVFIGCGCKAWWVSSV